MNQPVITLVELAPTEFGRLDTKIVKDVYYRFKTAPRALPILHGTLLQEGYNNVESIYTKYNPRGLLSNRNWDRLGISDIVGFSSIARTHPQTIEAADRTKQMNPTVKILLGGVHATYTDEECLENESVDIVIRREGDKTLPKLIRKLSENGSFEEVLGISYRKGSGIERTPDREPLTEEEFSNLPKPVFDKQIAKHMATPVEIASRGCPYDCDFCGVTNFYGDKYRRKSNEAIINDLKYLIPFSKRHIFFGDDNFAGKPRQTEELLEMMIDEGLNKHSYSMQIDAHSALRKGLAEKMKNAGTIFAYVGFEAIDQESLDSVGKRVTPKINEEAANTLRNAGIWVHGMFIIGLKGHDNNYLDYVTSWAKKHCDSVQFFSCVPLPGTIMTKQMREDKRILRDDYYLYDGQTVVIIPEKISPLELQLKLLDMHMDFYSDRNFSDSVRPLYRRIINPYARTVVKSLRKSPQMKAHIEFLRNWEKLVA